MTCKYKIILEKDNIKKVLSMLSFFAAVVIGFIALLVPPPGIIDQSVLWFTAQLLVFCSGLLGIDLNINGMAHTGKNKHEHHGEDADN